METKEKYSQKEWENFGLLNKIPDNRKSKITRYFNYLLKILKCDVNDDIEPLMFTIIRKIGIEVDITNNDINQIIIEARKAYINKHESEYVYALSMKCEFTNEFCENKINEFKNKNK
jgi:hypothetical protein